MTPPVEIQTERLILSGVDPALINELFTERSEAGIREYFALDDAGYDHLKFMHDGGLETYRISMCYFLLLEKDTRRVIGECGYHTINRTHRRAELFYSMRNDADKQKGFMREALEKVLDYGFNELGLHRIEALVADWNVPSVKLLQRYGFTKEGTMREDYVVNGKSEDSDCYSLLSWEWRRD